MLRAMSRNVTNALEKAVMEGDNPVELMLNKVEHQEGTLWALNKFREHKLEEIIIKSRVAWECIPKDGGKFHRKLNNIAKDR